jgi:hypothetical protein
MYYICNMMHTEIFGVEVNIPASRPGSPDLE